MWALRALKCETARGREDVTKLCTCVSFIDKLRAIDGLFNPGLVLI